MKPSLILVGVALASFALGAGGTYLLRSNPATTDRWLDIVSEETGIGFNDKVISVDFSLPNTRKPTGRIKFLKRDKGIQLGYILTLPIDPKPTKTLPEKYTHPTEFSNGFEIVPPDQLEYEGKFEFTLKDADGFVLTHLTGPKQYLVASSQNQVQGLVDDTTPPSIAERTKIVEVEFSVTDCVPCDPE